MQKCRLNGEAVYAFNVVNSNLIVNHEYEKSLRRASERGNLKCEGCGADIIFRYGKVNIAHFAHKFDILGGGCTYSNESEEHIQGKKLIFELMLKQYPDIEGEIRHRFSNGRWADLYFKFVTGEELVIEFQRNLSSLLKFEEKKEFYQSINLNNIWIVSGNIDEFENIVREYDFIFHHRFILNDNNNKLLVLDVERQRLLIASKAVVKDSVSGEIIFDEIINRSYGLNEINILPNGTIDCNFDSEFEDDKNRFVQAYLKQQQLEKEEQQRMEKVAKNRKEKLEAQERASSEKNKIKYNANTNKNNDSIPTNKYKSCDKDRAYYKDKVNKAVLGYRYGQQNLIRMLKDGGSSEYYLIKDLFDEHINSGNNRAKTVYDEVIKLAGLD